MKSYQRNIAKASSDGEMRTMCQNIHQISIQLLIGYMSSYRRSPLHSIGNASQHGMQICIPSTPETETKEFGGIQGQSVLGSEFCVYSLKLCLQIKAKIKRR